MSCPIRRNFDKSSIESKMYSRVSQQGLTSKDYHLCRVVTHNILLLMDTSHILQANSCMMDTSNNSNSMRLNTQVARAHTRRPHLA